MTPQDPRRTIAADDAALVLEAVLTLDSSLDRFGDVIPIVDGNQAYLQWIGDSTA